MFGIFAFQRARILAGLALPPATSPRLEPRLRDCIVLAGRGLRDKQIAHQLGLTHRTVESYLRDARRLFGARSKTDLVCAAILAGEVSLHEVGSGQAP
jgi:LuxR family quorum-sensing system transcriptional regulator CciR